MIFKVYCSSNKSLLKCANTTQEAEWEGRQMNDGLHTRNGRKLVGIVFLYFCWFLTIIYLVCKPTGRRMDAV